TKFGPNKKWFSFPKQAALSALSSKKFQKVLHLLQDLIKTTFYHNPYLEKGILTGILRTKADIYTNLDNLAEHNLLNPELSEYYDSGGTGLIDPILCSDNLQKDLQTLLENQSLTKRLDKQVDLDKIRPDETAFYSLLVFAEKTKADESTLFSLALSLEEKKLPKFSQQLKEFWAKTTKFFGTASPEQAELFAKGFLLSLRINLAHIYNISSEEDKNIWQLTPRKGNLNQVFIFGYQIGEEGEDLPLVAKNVLQRIKAR
ncbi:10871_t:CDS:2, partial [Racocetra persica]